MRSKGSIWGALYCLYCFVATLLIWDVAASTHRTSTTRGGFVQASDRSTGSRGMDGMAGTTLEATDSIVAAQRVAAAGVIQSENDTDVLVDEASSETHVETATTTVRPSALVDRMSTTIQSLLGPNQYVVVSILSDTQPSCGCLVVSRDRDDPSNHQCRFYPISPATFAQSLPMGHTVALLSDVVVIHRCDEWMAMGEGGDDAFVAGWTQRQRALGRGGIVLADHLPDPEQFVLQHSGWTPSILERFEVYDNEDWDIAGYLGDLLVDHSTTRTQSVSPDAEVFPLLFERTYRSLGGLGTLSWKNLVARDSYTSATGASPSLDDPEEQTVLARPHTLDGPSQHKDETLPSMPPIHQDLVGAAENPTRNTLGLMNAAESVWVLLDSLRTKQEDNVLSDGNMPLDFGAHAEAILEALASAIDNEASSIDESTTAAMLLQLNEQYDDHLEQLRDYFGKMYETMLDRSAGSHQGNTAPLMETIVRTFRSTAQEAIPVSARAGGRFCDKVDLNYVSALAGLSGDLETLSEHRHDIATEQMEDDEDLEEPTKRRRIPQWCKKLASRAIMLGVNYIQGRLALHALRQAALERERDMPKIPLF